ncbi:MAG: hypothetical protein F6K25_04340 [Okeania sp. SIO2G4]|uniref:toxin-antitoxin system TumE family protein n=1 Tax=unclassified Okeania TaxID=2634635 RepID=UPI0013BCD359|nr:MULTISPECIES: DUF6516 family protein [unclassified Okeania]NEP04865.1 hypothetical protein [Okeania sp. SIO4D6]NEP70952.1 hypothetical protein [Okeania sp. SIO2G5]NEP92268.1 hypothetical protein [Okeania sp. SIO2F5]NEQ90004.1 hypothetical protein [Okeania sp. SIO2G4]
MLFEDYLQELHDLIVACEVVQHFQIIPSQRSDFEGMIRGEIKFLDNSVLMVREFVDVELTINRDMYSYQYMTASNNLIFRYDNTRHHKKLNLPNFPHHKHEGIQDNVISSNAPTLVEVLEEIDNLLK